MKKTGIVILALIVILIIAVGTAAYAFYSSSRAEFTFIVESEEGASIGLNLINSSQTLTPANTSASVGDYTAVTGNNGEQYAAYEIQFVASSTLDIDFYITSVSYKDSAGNNFSAGDIAYMDSLLEYAIKIESDLTTYHIADGSTYNTSNLHTLQATDWMAKYDSTNSTTIAATSVNFSTLAQGTGYMFVYVRFNQSQELIPPTYDDMTISFTIMSVLNE